MAKARRKQAETADQNGGRSPAKAARPTKAERKQAKGARPTKAERKQAKAGRPTKAERKQAKAGGGRASARTGRKGPRADASAEERIEWRLARIEETVATQAERSEELLEKVDEMLQEPPDSAASANVAGPDGRAD